MTHSISGVLEGDQSFTTLLTGDQHMMYRPKLEEGDRVTYTSWIHCLTFENK